MFYVYLVGAWGGLLVLLVTMCARIDRARRRKSRALQAHITDLVEREIDRAYRAAGNPPPQPPTPHRRSE